MAQKNKKKAGSKSKITKSQKKTYVAIVLDRSGSMQSIRKQTIDGINEQLKALRDTADEGGITEVTLIQFDDQIETVFADKNAKDIIEFGEDQFEPRGWTAMRDGIWNAINHLKTKQSKKDSEGTDEAFLVCVISDGQENASKEITQQDLTAEIKRLQDGGKWTFTYLLANVDVHQYAAMYASPVANMASWTSNSAGATAASYTNSTSLRSYMVGTRGQSLTANTSFYSGDSSNGNATSPITIPLYGTTTPASTTAIPAQKKDEADNA